ncbi:MAG: PQQ-binding-like beta-propeller repeat protein [Anaerolineales bacterium]
MTNYRKLFVFAGLAIAVLLTGCGSVQAAAWPGITVDEENNSIYVSYNQFLYALQLDDGSERWRFQPERANNFAVFAPVQVTDAGELLVGAYNNSLYSLDPDDAGINWTFSGAANRFVGAPIIAGGNIFAPNSDHILYALDSEGDLQWTFGARQPLWSQPATDGTRVYVPSMDHHLYALDAASGDLIWGEDLGGTMVGSPALSEEGTLFIGTLNDEIVALDAVSGSVLWRFATDGWVWASPALTNGTVYAADLEGTVYALDAARGSEHWRVDTESAITGAPLVLNGNIYVINEGGEVISLTADGRIQWTQTFEVELYGPPVAAGDLILVGVANSESVLMALDTNGATVWTFAPEN